MLRSRLIIAFALVVFSQVVSAEKFKTPWLSGPVIDEVKLLSPSHALEISTLIETIHQNNGPQVQVYITSSLQGLSIEEASISIVETWKIGDEKRDDGVLFLVAPTERKLRIEVGQGLEGTIPDAYAKRINEDIVLPQFKRGQFSNGVLLGVHAIVGLLNKEGLVSLEKLAPKKSRKTFFVGWPVILLWLVILFLSRSGLFGRSFRSGWSRGGRGSAGGFGGGSWGGGSSGGGWSGGGGGFSGGGSSSSW
jgi:uncharacterized protein